MDSEATIDALNRLGFSQYESRAYVALLQRSPLNGHEASKASGVPPSKVYEALQRLEAKGAVLVYHSEPVRYAAVPYRIVLNGLRDRLEKDLNTAEGALSQLPTTHDPGLTWSLRQRDSILSAFTQALREAMESIYAALWDEELGELGSDLEAAVARGVEVHVAVYGHHVLQGPHSYDLTLCGESAVERLDGRRLSVVVADNQEAIVTEFRRDGTSEAIVTNNRVMSLLAVEYIKGDVMGRILINELGEARYQRLREQQRELAAMLRPVPAEPRK